MLLGMEAPFYECGIRKRKRFILHRDSTNRRLGGVAGDAESIVRVLELRRNAGASRTARDLDVVAPGASARSSPVAGFRAERIALGDTA